MAIHAVLGNRELANQHAAILDARPGGPMALLLASETCLCGAIWDLDVTPIFRARIQESEISWPPATLIRYPAKNW